MHHITTAISLLLLAAAAHGQSNDAPRGPHADLAYAGKLIEAGKHTEAEQLLARLVGVLPDSGAAWYQLALCRQLLGKTKDASIAVKQALTRTPKHVDSLLLAADLLALNDPETAKEHLATATPLAGDDPRPLRRMIKIYMRMHETAAALPLVEKAIVKAPNDEEMLRLQAEVALAAGDPKKAVPAYQALAKLRPKDPGPTESLGAVLLVLNRRAEAMDAFKASLEIHPSNVAARSKLIKLMEDMRLEAREIGNQKRMLTYYTGLRARAARKTDAAPR